MSSRHLSPSLRDGVRPLHAWMRRGLVALSLATLCAVPLSASVAQEPPPLDDEQGASPWPIDDANPSASLPGQEAANKNPMGYGYMLMSLAETALNAEEAKDWDKALRYYQALAKAAPERALGLQKVCEIENRNKDYAAALNSCHQVLSRKGVEVRDFMMFVRTVAQAPPELGVARKDDALNALDHLAKEHPAAAMRARCLLGTRFADRAMLELCVPAVLELEQDKVSAEAASFAWQLEIVREDWDAAQVWLDRAKAAGGEETVLLAMQQLIDDKKSEARSGVFRNLRRGLLILCVVALFVWWRRNKDKQEQTA